jgi:ribonuclease HII
MGGIERTLRADGFSAVAGTDEVGRGCLAGPVVAAAVILGDESVLPGLDDSKRLSATGLRSLCAGVLATARAVGVGVVEAVTIDRINILEASKLAMRHAVEALPVRPDALLLDAVYVESLMVPQLPVIKGDARSVSVAAASIVAKVYRDSLMESYHELYPQYDFVNNVGYGTANHCKALEEYGPSPIHRRGFRGVIDQHLLFG